MRRHSSGTALAVVLMPLLAATAAAQAPDSSATSAAPPAAATVAAATELLEIMEVERLMQASATSMLEMQVRAQPVLAPFRDVMMEWMRKYVTMEVMGARLASVYAESFTESELRDLIAFYRTPTGQKLARLQPELTQRGAEVGQQVAQEHQAELEQMIRKRAEELENEGRTP
jgi:hypothetical protein